MGLILGAICGINSNEIVYPGGGYLRVMCSSWCGRNLRWVPTVPGGWSATGRSWCPRDLITLAARSVTPPTQSYSTYFTLKRIASRNLRVRTGAAGPLQWSTGSELPNAGHDQHSFCEASQDKCRSWSGQDTVAVDQTITDAMSHYSPV